MLRKCSELRVRQRTLHTGRSRENVCGRWQLRKGQERFFRQRENGPKQERDAGRDEKKWDVCGETTHK